MFCVHVSVAKLSDYDFLANSNKTSRLGLGINSILRQPATGIVKINRHSPILQPTSPTSFIRLVRLAFSQHPLLRFKPHNVFLKQLRHISRWNFRHCHTNSPHQITNHRQILRNLSWSLETQIVSRKIISNGAIQLEWCNRTDHNMFHSSTQQKKKSVTKHILGRVKRHNIKR